MAENIHFTTSHNVVLSYPLAGMGSRILAFFLDVVIISIFLTIVGFITQSFDFNFLISSIAFLCYHLISEIFWGRSIGKKVCKIAIVSLDGSTPTIKQSLIRWVFRMVDIGFTLGLQAIISIFTSDREQRLGDLMAGTTVISERSDYMEGKYVHYNIDTSKNDLPEVLMKYNDDQMLTVKTILNRCKKNRSDANLSLLHDIAQKLKASVREKQQAYENDEEYVERILKNYIQITR